MPRPPDAYSVILAQYLASLGRLEAQQGKDTDAVGRVPILLTGSTLAAPSNATPRDCTCEGTHTVTFANGFTAIPSFNFGWELDAGSEVVYGRFPTVNAGVLEWVTENWQKGLASPKVVITKAAPSVLGNAVKTFPAYTGVKICFVATGQVGQKLWLHYSFTGRALPFSNAPVTPTTSNTLTVGEAAAQVAAAGDTALEFFGGLLTPGAGNSQGTGVS